MDDNLKDKHVNKSDDSIRDFIISMRELWSFLLTKWKIILIVGLSGGVIGLGLSFIIKPKYRATVSFSLIENSRAGAGLASLASSFGFGGLLGGGSDVFTGDNLLEIMKSRYTIESTLLTPISFENEEISLADAYLKVYKKDKKFKKKLLKKNPDIVVDNMFPLNQQREDFSRFQDSILHLLHNNFIKSKKLTVIRKEKKISMVSANFTSLNEEFSKVFIEELIQQTIKFYMETRTAQSRKNIEMMEHTADSIRSLYEEALHEGAMISQLNVNKAIQTAAVPRLQHEYNVQLYGTVYAEVLKNLETLKLDMLKETPIIQLIDQPIYPLKEVKLGKAKGLAFGGLIGGFLIVMYLFGVFYLKKVL